MERLFQLYKIVLLAHIQTKTVDSVFHEKSQEFYELLFNVFHTLSEKRQDIEVDKPMSCEKATQVAYEAIEEAKTILEAMVDEKNSIWMDNILRGMVDQLEGACGDARAFIEQEKEENQYEAVKSMLPKTMPRLPR